jgi:hypothetical protein
MPKFLVLYRSEASARAQMSKATPEQAKAGMDAWMAWSKENGAALVDLGSPLGKSTTLTKSGRSAGDDEVSGFLSMPGT